MLMVFAITQDLSITILQMYLASWTGEGTSNTTPRVTYGTTR